ncbi:MAG: PASTA domain-containing protein [Acidobacteriota bacterium]
MKKRIVDKLNVENMTQQEKFFFLGKVFVLAGVLVALFLFSGLLGMRFTVRGHVLKTPSIVGMSLDNAKEIFSRTELELVVGGNRYDENTPSGYIVSQVPGSGMGIKSNGKVMVIASLGRKSNPVPDLTGSSLRAARVLAEQSSYTLGRVSEISMGSKEDHVVSQFPVPDSDESVSDNIDVLVTRKKPQEYVMPDLVGMDLSRTLRLLRDFGFDVDQIRYRRYAGVPRGSVVRQFPQPGYRLGPDLAIDLEVAR